tara:strand:- start:19910 stop:20593 length:684 start_codon:yes stop_codon:yes gene_type:complete
MMFEHSIIKEYVKNNQFENIEYNPRDNNRLAIIVETRKNNNLEWVAKTVKHHLNWNIRFFCSHESKDCITDVQKSIIPRNIDYSRILKDSEFWNDIDEEHILVFQHDSFVLRSGIEEFLDYDYIGPPWYWANGEHQDNRYKDLTDFQKGGNGGFSLRKKSAMVNIINSNPPDYEYEDMYFSNALSKDIPLETKQRFAVESMFYENPLGVHQLHRYLSGDQVKKILFK